MKRIPKAVYQSPAEIEERVQKQENDAIGFGRIPTSTG
jgi:hypothetical protein